MLTQRKKWFSTELKNAKILKYGLVDGNSIGLRHRVLAWGMREMIIPKETLQKTLLAGVLKGIGVTARIGDVPSEFQSLKKRVKKRELTVFGIVIVTSLVLDSLFNLLPKSINSNPYIKFLPQMAAFTFAEWYSRVSTNYRENYRKSLAKSEENDDDDDDDKKALQPDIPVSQLAQPTVPVPVQPVQRPVLTRQPTYTYPYPRQNPYSRQLIYPKIALG
jgi:hypothetical protein